MGQSTKYSRIESAVIEPPWYRQFWPWFLIALPASVVIASVFTIRLAVESGDTLVSDDYYKDGLAINQSMARDQRAIDLQISGVLEFTDQGIFMRIQGVKPASVLAAFRHPFDANLDRIVELVQIDTDTYYSPEKVDAQRWYVELSEVLPSEDANDSWRIQAEQDFSARSRLYFGEH